MVSRAHLNSHVRSDDLPLHLCYPKKIEIVFDTIFVQYKEKNCKIKCDIEGYFQDLFDPTSKSYIEAECKEEVVVDNSI